VENMNRFLDQAVYEAILEGHSDFHAIWRYLYDHKFRFSESVLDHRLQFLRNAGLVKFVRGKRRGWFLVER